MKASLGPFPTSVGDAPQTLEALWAQTGVDSRAYTGNLVTLTTRRHLKRVYGALSGLEGRYAGRQIIGVMDGRGGLKVEAALVPQPAGLFVERLTLEATPKQLQGAILPLLRPATVNHVWWAADEKPAGALLSELTELADQVILDSLNFDIPPARHFALADLGWSRSASWREALAQVFDSPEAARQLPYVDRLTVCYAGENDLPARLYAGFIADCLGWHDLSGLTLEAGRCGRENGDLCGVELAGDDVRFSLSAEKDLDVARAEAEWDGKKRVSEINVPPMNLTEGLARVMARPDRSEVFERAWALAKATMK